jgi:hypothetical protein
MIEDLSVLVVEIIEPSPFSIEIENQSIDLKSRVNILQKISTKFYQNESMNENRTDTENISDNYLYVVSVSLCCGK